VPVDREDFTVRGEPVTLRVRPLPEAGRPAAFAGAVGRFTVSARTTASRVRPMESFPLVLEIAGEGNLDAFPPPRLEPAGFHVFGRTDAGGSPRRITYDVAAIDASPSAVPALAFAYFDPAAGAYREARTEPIPIEVIGAPEPEEHAFPWWIPVVVAVAVAAVAARMRRRREPDAVERAAAAFRAGGGFPAFLAALLGCPEPAVISPDLAARLEGAGVPPDLAARASALVERVTAARYAGGAAPSAGDADDEARALVEAITARRRRAPGS